MSLVAALLRPRLFSSKLSKLKVTEKYSGSATTGIGFKCIFLVKKMYRAEVTLWYNWSEKEKDIQYNALFLEKYRIETFELILLFKKGYG
jgi:hypothetical protein